MKRNVAMLAALFFLGTSPAMAGSWQLVTGIDGEDPICDECRDPDLTQMDDGQRMAAEEEEAQRQMTVDIEDILWLNLLDFFSN